MKELAISAAKEAGLVLMKDFGEEGKVRIKPGGEPVTDSDIRSEKRIIDIIRERYPSHSILSEEGGLLKGDLDYIWMVDPLDGTRNFIRKLPYFGVSIALEHEGRVILGVVNLPYFDELYVAERGKGAYLNGKRIAVSNRGLKESLLLYESKFHKMPKLTVTPLRDLASSVNTVRVLGVTSMSLSLIASGRAEAYIAYAVKPMDIAGGAIILEEAGGVITDLNGNAWSPYMKRIVATNGVVHGKILEILRRRLTV